MSLRWVPSFSTLFVMIIFPLQQRFWSIFQNWHYVGFLWCKGFPLNLSGLGGFLARSSWFGCGILALSDPCVFWPRFEPNVCFSCPGLVTGLIERPSPLRPEFPICFSFIDPGFACTSPGISRGFSLCLSRWIWVCIFLVVCGIVAEFPLLDRFLKHQH